LTSALLELFDRCVAKYRAGDDDFENYYDTDDLAFLESIGYRKREFFDFVEDFGDGGDPSPSTAVLVASVRRDYFRWVMEGEKGGKDVKPEDLPGREETLGGIRWLPRIIVKARGKLRGELDPDIMYSCGGDRAFLREHDIAPADFLRIVWASGDDDEKVLDYVKRAAER